MVADVYAPPVPLDHVDAPVAGLTHIIELLWLFALIHDIKDLLLILCISQANGVG